MKKTIFIIVVVLSTLLVSTNLRAKGDDVRKIEIRDHQIEIKGVRVHYSLTGNPENPPLIYLHGIGSSFEKLQWRNSQVLPILAKNFYVYAPEHPGFFRSQMPSKTWTVDDYNEYIEEFINQLGIENPVIVGQSFGGKLAAYYASKHPNEIKLLVLGAPSITFRGVPIYEKFYRFLGPLAGQTTRMKYVPDGIKRFIVEKTLGVPKNLVEPNLARYTVMADFVTKTAIVDDSDIVSLITTKTLLFWGKWDFIVPSKQTKLISKKFPTVETYELIGGHTIMIDQAETTLKFILDNLAVETP